MRLRPPGPPPPRSLPPRPTTPTNESRWLVTHYTHQLYHCTIRTHQRVALTRWWFFFLPRHSPHPPTSRVDSLVGFRKGMFFISWRYVSFPSLFTTSNTNNKIYSDRGQSPPLSRNLHPPPTTSTSHHLQGSTTQATTSLRHPCSLRTTTIERVMCPQDDDDKSVCFGFYQFHTYKSDEWMPRHSNTELTGTRLKTRRCGVFKFSVIWEPEVIGIS